MLETFTVETEEPIRIDRYLASVSKLSRTRVQALCDEGLVRVDDKPVKSSYKLSDGEVIEAEIPADQELQVEPENIPLDILYEDSDIIVVNKPKGMVVHPAPGHENGTLVNALLYHCHDLSGINGVLRPGIVHRIDKDTTGCLVAAKNDAAHRSLAKQLEDKTCHREYRAIVEGILDTDAAVIDAPIGRDPRNRQRMAVTDVHGRSARTHYRVLERFRDTTYIECKLETGRTHQIRVHMTYIGHPLLGDPVYGPKKQPINLEGQALHARVLGFIHPRTGEYMEFEAPLPPHFEALLERLRK